MLEQHRSEPIYIQIATWLENEILEGSLLPHSKVYSQYQLAEMFNINPATAGKGLTILLEKELVYKKRGLGTFVSENAPENLLAERKDDTLQKLIDHLLEEAKRLNIPYEQLLDLLNKAYEDKGGQ